jgi:hypothetical protein
VIATQVDVHEAGDLVARLRVAVVVDALHQRAGAVADADDRDAATAAMRCSRVTIERSAMTTTAATNTRGSPRMAQMPRPTRKIVSRASRGAKPTFAVTPRDSAFARV